MYFFVKVFYNPFDYCYFCKNILPANESQEDIYTAALF